MLSFVFQINLNKFNNSQNQVNCFVIYTQYDSKVVFFIIDSRAFEFPSPLAYLQ
jgi:hypothetical protein